MAIPMILAAVHSAPAHPWGWHGGGWWWTPFAFLFWLGVAAVVAWLLTHTTTFSRPHQPTGVERARDILAERLANGEISPEEYYERRSALS